MAPFKFVHRISRGLPIDKYGDGSSCRDYTFIDDIVAGVIAAIDRPQPCEVINLGNSQVVSLNEFISVVEELVGKKAVVNQMPEQPGDVPLTYADCGKAERLLRYNPRFSIREGMARFVDWYLKFYAEPSSDASSDSMMVDFSASLPLSSSPRSSPLPSDIDSSEEEAD